MTTPLAELAVWVFAGPAPWDADIASRAGAWLCRWSGGRLCAQQMTAESAGAQSGPLTLAASHGSASGARDEVSRMLRLPPQPARGSDAAAGNPCARLATLRAPARRLLPTRVDTWHTPTLLPRHGPPSHIQDRLAASRLSRLVAGREAHLLAVADGHSGSAAAAFVSERAAPTLEALLQPLSRPAAAEQDGTTLAPRLQEALVFTLLEVNRQFAAQGYASGCSLLLALVAGDVLTVASLGSSRCTLDVGAGAPLDLSADHRINYNPRELERLWAAGCLVAPAPAGTAPSPYAACASDGVLRLWPGGLALARSFGDFHLSQAVLPLPHVKQVRWVSTTCWLCAWLVQARAAAAAAVTPVAQSPALVRSRTSCSTAHAPALPARRWCCHPAAAAWCWQPALCGLRWAATCT